MARKYIHSLLLKSITQTLLGFTLLLSALNANAAHQLGDLAPRGNTDGVLNAGDLVVLQKLVNGTLTPTAEEIIIGNVAPLGAPDTVLNGADVLVLQRAVLGQITLGSVDIIPSTPMLDAIPVSPTNVNPYTITGTSVVGATVEIYVNGVLAATTTALADNTFSVDVILSVGNNTIYAIASDGGAVSPQSNTVSVEFQLAEGGPLTGNVSGMTLPANTRYTVDIAGITISTASTPLIIEHGVRLEFPAGSGITVSGWDGVNGGMIQVNGLPDLPVVFTSSEAIPAAGDWLGIEINRFSTTNIDYAIIEYAVNGVYFNNTDNGGVKYGGSVSNSIIRYNTNGVNVFEYATPTLTTNQIYSNDIGVLVDGGSFRREARPTVTDSEIYNNSQWNYFAMRTPLGGGTGVEPITLVATNTWWGSADPVVISTTIHDTFDPDSLTDPLDTAWKRPFIDFSGFLDAPAGISVGDIMPPLIHVNVNPSYAGNKVFVVGDVLISYDGTLILNAGTEVRVTGAYKIEMKGLTSTRLATLQVNGTALDPVVFTSNQAIPAASDWKGIVIDTNSNVSIDYAVIEYATSGVFFNSNSSGGAPGGILSNSTLRNNIDAVDVYRISTPTILNNSIYENNRAFYIHGNAGSASVANTSPIINNNQIYSNTQWNIYTENVLLPGATIGTSVGIINARNNWWGTADPLEIFETIHDYFDIGVNTENPVIDFGGALDAPAGNPLSVYVYEAIDTSTTFSGDVYLFGDNSFSAANTLSISAGASLYFYANARLDVMGNFSAAGTLGNEISFLPMEASYTRDYWGGVKFIGPGQTVNVDYCIAMGAARAFEFENSDGNLSNCFITENAIGVYLISDSGPTLSNDTITGNDTGIYLNGSDRAPAVGVDPHPVIINSDIYDNTNFNLEVIVTTDLSGMTFSNIWWGSTDLATIKSKINFIYGNSQSDLIFTNSIATALNNASALLGFSIDNVYISPGTSPGINDGATITGAFSGTPNWTIEIKDVTNSVVKTYSGTNTVVNVSWAGDNQSAAPLGDGVYTVNIRNNSQLVASKFIHVDNTLPVANLDDSLNGAVINATEKVITGFATDLNFTSYVIEVADSFTPLEADYRTLHNGTSNINGFDLYTWMISNFDDFDNPVQEVSGDKTLRLTVTDVAGNSSVDLAQVTLEHVSITNVSYSPTEITPALGETVAVNFTIGRPATVYLRFYTEIENRGGSPPPTLIAEVVGNYAAAGSYTLTWDGKDNAGNNVPDEAYRFEIYVEDALGSNIYFIPSPFIGAGVPTRVSFGKATAAFQTLNNSNYHRNEYVKIEAVVTDGPVRVFTNTGATASYGVADGGKNVTDIFDNGTHILLWDGRTAIGRMIDTTAYLSNGYLVFDFAPNSVRVKGNSPRLLGTQAYPDIEVKADPYLVTHSYDQVSQVEFTVSMDSDVTVTLIPPCYTRDATCISADVSSPGAVVLVDNAPMTSSDGAGGLQIQSFEWRGYDFEAPTPDTNNPLITEDGTYTYLISATSVASGITTEYRGSLQLRQ